MHVWEDDRSAQAYHFTNQKSISYKRKKEEKIINTYKQLLAIISLLFLLRWMS